ncbi:MAG: AIR synthase related protein, partial [Candidatus Odinarchaeia archaeon]
MVKLEELLIKDIGERQLVDLIQDVIGEGKGLNLLPHPEDASAVKLKNGVFVLGVDSFVASTDMPPKMAFYDVGWKSAIMNFSDLAAKGAQPM